MEEIPKWLADFFKEAAPLIKKLRARGARLEYMPLYINAFFADEKVNVMTTEQRGGYLQLLMRAWLQDDPASLPNDDHALMKWAGLSAAKWKQSQDVVLKPFYTHEGRLYQKRLCSAWILAAKNYVGRSKGGFESGKAKRAKAKTKAEHGAEHRTEHNAEHAPTSNTTRITQPNPPNPKELPPQPNPESQTGEPPGPGVGGSKNASGSGLGSGRVNNIGRELRRTVNGGTPRAVDFDRMEQVRPILDTLQLNNALHTKLLNRNDVTADRLNDMIADIRTDPNVDDVGAIVVFRLGEAK